ncbi:branched-chain amino acid transporter permease [Kocuria sp.]|uniref:branched-chain amino acid transporter permease n=1 Tax=Kocuria sp. TaxID=1871328 RepID=UPI0026DEA6CF|nr:AzlD domain-containing protein [Kocuria sp.]MDO5618495.1 AzlD domain-containing protein [Kocuria sp.]
MTQTDTSTGYILAVMAIMFAVTFCLRALPFALLKPLRESRFVLTLAVWMPVGVLAVLAAATFAESAHGGQLGKAVVAALVTLVVHLSCGRRTLLSVGLGTLTYVVLVNFW